ncbi:MAG: amidase [Planctomycetota bacterium]
MEETPRYDLKSIRVPRLAGKMLALFVRLVENRLTQSLLIQRLLKDTGIIQIRKIQVEEAPEYYPLYPQAKDPKIFEVSVSDPLQELLRYPRIPAKGFAFPTIGDYAKAYRSGKITPQEVAQKIIAAMEESDRHLPPLKAFIACQREDLLKQAEASTRRFRENCPLGILEGVPIGVKDEVDQVPYGTTVGTRIFGKTPALQDSTVVAKVRATGALLIGKTNMHEIGIGVTGLNPHYGVARNPYHLGHHTGGSSSGSAAATAAGFCPAAISADGGGSIRIPAAFCGMVGLKATFGRVSEFGAAPLAWSVAHLGPIAVTAYDAAILYSVMAGPDSKDSNSLFQPSPIWKDFDQSDLKGITIGIYRDWFQHATPAMVESCEQLLKKLEEHGARIQEIYIPHLESIRLAHVVSIASEMVTAMGPYYPKRRKEFGLDVRTNLGIARALKASDYVQAQRIRRRAMDDFQRVLQSVDLIVTPSTGCTAPPIRPQALPNGESDLAVLTEIMRFAPAGNLTGLPSISFPAGYDLNGLPIGFQAMGRPWEEHLLLRLAHLSEQWVERKKPELYFPILP